MKTILARTRFLLAVLLMFVGVLLTCYTAIANGRRGAIRNAINAVEVSPAENDDDPEYLEKRREFLRRFFGTEPGGMSPRAYASAFAAARGLPPSPLLQGRRFMSRETLEAAPAWTFPISAPIQNSYGGNASATVYGLAIDPINVYVGTGRFVSLPLPPMGGEFTCSI